MPYKPQDYISIVERTDSDFHRSPIILHKGGDMFYIAEFQTLEQLDIFAQTLGFTYAESEQYKTKRFGLYRRYQLDRQFDSKLFCRLEQLPEGSKPIKAHSNGSIVTCYYTNDGATITFYRPNPNMKDIYQPLSIDQHIQHHRIYGSY